MSRPILSRPRTKVYDANYNIGESYYKSALDRLDRKYSGRPLSPPPRNPTFPADLAERHERAFFDEDLGSARRRAEKTITGENGFFDSRGARIAARALENFENAVDEESSSSLRRLRAHKKRAVVDDVDLESTVNNISSKRLLERQEKVLSSVGINESSRRALDEDVSFKRRSLRVTYEDEQPGNSDLTRWTPLEKESTSESAAVARARQSKARINDIEEEMAAIAEKQAARERRSARLKALVAEANEETEAVNNALQSVSISARREKQTIEY